MPKIKKLIDDELHVAEVLAESVKTWLEHGWELVTEGEEEIKDAATGQPAEQAAQTPQDPQPPATPEINAGESEPF